MGGVSNNQGHPGRTAPPGPVTEFPSQFSGQLSKTYLGQWFSSGGSV